MSSSDLIEYKYKGARALVILHEKHMRSLLMLWREAKKQNVTLPKTDDSDYKSLEAVLYHVFRAARGYMIWMCNKLSLPDPKINRPPNVENINDEADKYLEHLLEKWLAPLVELPEEIFHNPSFKSNWGVDYSIDAMLEHAVMHPIRHEFQLKNLIDGQK
jgi:uncharacterized damage-inducible protein DinB